MKKTMMVLICLVFAAMGLCASHNTGELFPACYLVGGDVPGAPLFTVNVLVNTPTRTMSGHGGVDWPIDPQWDLKTDMKGGYVTVAMMKESHKVVATLTGYPVVVWPPSAGIAPVEPPNTHLLMVLASDWKTGTATFSFMDSAGKWHEIKDAPVKMVECFSK